MIKPLRDYVVLKKIADEQKTASGIVLPQTVKEEKNIAVVRAVGSGKSLANSTEKLPLEVKKGDKVLYSQFSGSYVELDGEKYIIIREDDIMAIL